MVEQIPENAWGQLARINIPSPGYRCHGKLFRQINETEEK